MSGGGQGRTAERAEFDFTQDIAPATATAVYVPTAIFGLFNSRPAHTSFLSQSFAAKGHSLSPHFFAYVMRSDVLAQRLDGAFQFGDTGCRAVYHAVQILKDVAKLVTVLRNRILVLGDLGNDAGHFALGHLALLFSCIECDVCCAHAAGFMYFCPQNGQYDGISFCTLVRDFVRSSRRVAICTLSRTLPVLVLRRLTRSTAVLFFASIFLTLAKQLHM